MIHPYYVLGVLVVIVFLMFLVEWVRNRAQVLTAADRILNQVNQTIDGLELFRQMKEQVPWLDAVTFFSLMQWLEQRGEVHSWPEYIIRDGQQKIYRRWYKRVTPVRRHVPPT